MKKNFSIFIFLFLISLFFACQSNTSSILREMYAGYYSIAEEYFSMKKYDKAAIYYEKCLLDKDGEIKRSVQYKLAKTYIQLEKYEQARQIYESLLTIDENNQNLKSSIAFCYLKSNQFDKAESIYNELLEAENQDSANYKNLILLKLIKDDLETAESLISSYKEKFPLDESISTLETALTKSKEEKANKDASKNEQQSEDDEDLL